MSDQGIVSCPFFCYWSTVSPIGTTATSTGKAPAIEQGPDKRGHLGPHWRSGATPEAKTCGLRGHLGRLRRGRLFLRRLLSVRPGPSGPDSVRFGDRTGEGSRRYLVGCGCEYGERGRLDTGLTKARTATGQHSKCVEVCCGGFECDANPVRMPESMQPSWSQAETKTDC